MTKIDNIFDSTTSSINYSRTFVKAKHLHNLSYRDGQIVWVCRCVPVNKLAIERVAKVAFRKVEYVS